MNDHCKLEYRIEQLDGSTEKRRRKKSDKKKEHDDLCFALLCFGVTNVKNRPPDCKGWEYQFSKRPAIKAHMHNEHGITIF